MTKKPYGGLNGLLQNIAAMDGAQLSAYLDEQVRPARTRSSFRTRPISLTSAEQEEIYRLSRLSDEEFKTDAVRLMRALIAGDKTAIPHIVGLCLSNDREVPDLVKRLFVEACRSIGSYEFPSWDDFFGSHLKKGAQLAAARRRLALGFTVWAEVKERRTAGEPISKDMFEDIAKGLKFEGKTIGGTLASEAYREFKKRLPRMDMSLRRGFRTPTGLSRTSRPASSGSAV